MNLALFALVGFFALPVIFVYGDSGTEIDKLLEQGKYYFGQAEYDKAISQFEQILIIDPNNIDALYYKGNTLSQTGKFKDAIPFYEKVLALDPHKFIAQLKLQEALLKVTSYRFNFLEGVVEITVHDSHGGLVAYLRATEIKALKHKIVEDLVDSWPTTKLINQNGKSFAVHQQEFVKVVDYDTIFGFHEIPYSDKVDFPLTSTWHYQLPIEKGDEIRYVYSILRPVS
ncbi:MAG: tetratricopeptide repeat protein [Nitrosopumilaceae archaeon]